jgi:NTE family protein
MAKHNIALVLSSGGARGVAHIAVIEELLKDGHKITSIAGASMGAVIGGIYAGGKLTEFTEWLSDLDYWDVFNLLDFSISSNGFIKGEKVFKRISPYIPDVSIEDLDIPFVTVAADIVNKKAVVYDKGDLTKAIRASVSIPTVLHPVKQGDSVIVDGGVVNPVPVDLIKRHPDDKLVVVDVNANVGFEKPEVDKEAKSFIAELRKKYIKWRKSDKVKEKNLGVFDILNESFELTQEALTKHLLEQYKPDLTVQISREFCDTMDFHKTPEILELGRKSYRTAIEKSDLFSIENEKG